MVGGDRQEEEAEAHDETIPRRRADHDNGAVGNSPAEEEDAFGGSLSSVAVILADNIMVGVVVANEL